MVCSILYQRMLSQSCKLWTLSLRLTICRRPSMFTGHGLIQNTAKARSSGWLTWWPP
uniref:Uncharacterized protein n=1 Tax=Arundo donax TaxID=35708 RepID=A0A0A9CVS0_ARUDO